MSQTRDLVRSLPPRPNAEKWYHFSAFVMAAAAIAILLLGFALRLYLLDNKGFWGDEIFQVRQSLRPLSALLTRGQTPEIYDDFALHFVVLHLVGQLGRSEFWLRLPSVGYSVLAMAGTFLLGTRLFGRGAGLIAMLLMAVAPFQIWYAQETRMYAAHTFYSALSFYLFLRLFRRVEWGAWAGLVLVNALGLYNHLFMVFPLLVEGIVGLVLVLAGLRGRTGRRWGELIVGSLAATFLLSLPLVLGFLPYLSLQLSTPGSEPGNVLRKIDWSFVRDLVMYLGLGSDWSWRVVLSAGLALFGGGWLLRRDWKMIWIALVFIVPLVTLYLVTPVGNIAHRYLIFMQPLYLALIAGGVWGLARGGVKLVAPRDSGRATRAAVIATMIGLGVLGIVIAPPLAALYPRAKLNDWRAVTNYIRAHVGANDLVRLENASWSERAFRWYFPDVRAQFANVNEMENARLRNQSLWYVSFGGFFDPESDQWARQHLTRVAETQWQQSNLVYSNESFFKFPQSESPTIIYRSEW